MRDTCCLNAKGIGTRPLRVFVKFRALIFHNLRHYQCRPCTTHSSSSSSPRYPLSDWFLPVFGTVDTGKGWNSQVCPRAIEGITSCHKMRHSLSLPTVTYICMGELPHFHHGPTTSFLHSQPIQAPPSGPGLKAPMRLFVRTVAGWAPHLEFVNFCRILFLVFTFVLVLRACCLKLQCDSEIDRVCVVVKLQTIPCHIEFAFGISVP